MPPRGAAAELAGLTGVWAAVKYLVSVGAQHMDLIQAHAQCAARLPTLPQNPACDGSCAHFKHSAAGTRAHASPLPRRLRVPAAAAVLCCKLGGLHLAA